MHTIEDISERTGLSIKILRKCINYLKKPILNPYITRGNNNRLLFDNNAFVIFDNIKQMKQENNLSLPEIKQKLKETLQQSGKSEEGKGVQTSGKSGVDNQDSILLEKLLQAHQTIAEEKEKRLQQLTEKDQTILDLETKKQTLENSLKLLPEGKSPEQLRREWEENYKIEKEKIKIVTEVRATGSLRFRKRKKLLNRLEELYNG